MRIRKNTSDNFTAIPNSILRTKRLSLKAKGLHCYLFSLPDNWDLSVDKISNDLKEGYKAISTAIKELESVGLVERKYSRIKGDKGQIKSVVDYIIFDKMADMPKGRDNKRKNSYRRGVSSKHCSLLYFDHLKATENIKDKLSKK